MKLTPQWAMDFHGETEVVRFSDHEAALAEAVAKERREIAELVYLEYCAMPLTELIAAIHAKGDK